MKRLILVFCLAFGWYAGYKFNSDPICSYMILAIISGLGLHAYVFTVGIPKPDIA